MTVRGLLLDLEGVLYQEDRPIPGALQAVRDLAQGGLRVRFLTNTTIRPRRDIARRMHDMGFAVEETQVFTPARAAVHLLQHQGLRRLHLAAPATLAEDFAGFDLVESAPDAVVLGDLQQGFTWERLDGLFAMLRGGAKLVALHKNRYCTRAGELALDLGPFVAALEYAARVEAQVVGKPAQAYFLGALEDLGLAPEDALMVGDDIEADIEGARAAGLAAVQVKTGKYRASDEAHPTAKATGRIGSIVELREWLNAH